jgi:MFS family permease
MKPMTEKIPSKTMLLFTILLAVFIVPMSLAGTGIILPAIGQDLGTKINIVSLQWVAASFNLFFASFTLLWGALADRFGRSKTFTMGCMLFAIASIASGLAPNGYMLDIARAFAGIGAAAVFACGPAILSNNFSGHALTRAFALFGSVAGAGVAFGPTMAGVLLHLFGWQSVFYIHAIALVLVTVLSLTFSNKHTQPEHNVGFDWSGSVLFVVGLFALMFAIVQSSQWGGFSVPIISILVGVVILFTLFVYREKRYPAPMLHLEILKDRVFLAMTLVPVVLAFCYVTIILYLPIYLMSVLQFNPVQAGIAIVLLTGPVFVLPFLSSKLIQIGLTPKTIISIAMGFMLVSIFSLQTINPSSSILSMALPMLMGGISMGLSFGTVDGIALSTIPAEKSGMAAGLLNTFRLGSEAIAITIFASIFTTALYANLHSVGITLVGTEHLSTWLNAVAEGHVNASLSLFKEMSVTAQQYATQQAIVGYDKAFHVTLWVMAGIGVALTAWILKLLKSPRSLSSEVRNEPAS